MASIDAIVPSDEEIKTVLNQGWKNLKIKNIQQAVNNFQESCDILSKKYGETSFENADSLFGYGCALLELARMENGVLGNALNGIAEKAVGEASEQEPSLVEVPITEDTFVEEDGTTEEEKEKISEEVIEAMLDGNKEEEKENQTETKGETKPDDEAQEAETAEETENDKDDEAELDEEEDGDGDEDENGADEVCENSVVEATPCVNETEEGEGTDTNEDNAEVGNLQVGWEVLELARTIYDRERQKHENEKCESSGQLKEIMLKQADCLLKLGEVGVESETYDSAIEDYFTCKELLSKAGLQSDHRRFAEISYQLGLAYGYKGCFDLSKKHYEEALEVIEKRISNCQEQLKELIACNLPECEKSNEEIENLKSELESLTSLVPDIKIKIEDCTEEINKVVFEVEDLQESEFSTETSTTKEVTTINISHLVRKKRKTESEDDGVHNDAKKLKVDELVVKEEETVENGAGDSLGTGMESNEAATTTVENSLPSTENSEMITSEN